MKNAKTISILKGLIPKIKNNNSASYNNKVTSKVSDLCCENKKSALYHIYKDEFSVFGILSKVQILYEIYNSKFVNMMASNTKFMVNKIKHSNYQYFSENSKYMGQTLDYKKHSLHKDEITPVQTIDLCSALRGIISILDA